MSRRGIVSHSYKAVFFCSPKAACSSLFNLLLDQDEFAKLLDERGSRKKSVKNLRRAYSEPWQNALKPIQEDGYKSIVLARNPTDRIVSAYINKFVVYPRGAGALTHGRHLESFALDLLANHSLRQLEDSLGTLPAPLRKLARRWFMRGNMCNNLSFDQFLDQVAHEHRTRKDPDLPSVDGHWDTQVPPGLLSTGFRYDHIIRMENLDEDWEAVSADIGIPPFTKHLNRSPDATTSGQSDHKVSKPSVTLRSDQLKAGQLATIRDLFKLDYQTLGYDMP